MKEREKKTAFEKKYLRIKFQDSLCAIQKDEVYQQSAKGILREEIDFFFLPPGGEKKIIRGRGSEGGKKESKTKQKQECVF